MSPLTYHIQTYTISTFYNFQLWSELGPIDWIQRIENLENEIVHSPHSVIVYFENDDRLPLLLLYKHTYNQQHILGVFG